MKDTQNYVTITRWKSEVHVVMIAAVIARTSRKIQDALQAEITEIGVNGCLSDQVTETFFTRRSHSGILWYMIVTCDDMINDTNLCIFLAKTKRLQFHS